MTSQPPDEAPAKAITLKVAEAIQDDVNKGIVRIDSNFMREIEIRPGDIVEIEGERKTVGITDRAYPGDIGLNIIRMDGIIRRNAKTGIGEIVTIRKALVREAKKVIIAPASKGVIMRASPNIFKQGLLARAVMKGDIISMGGARRRKTTMPQSPFFNDIFNMLDENMMGIGFGDLKFIVVDTQPKQVPVIISETTSVEFNPEAVEVKEEKVLEVTYEDIGGLEEEITKVREMVELPLKHPEIFERLGIEAPKGVLLHGPPGTGKTLLAKAVANETNSNFILINGPEIMSKFYGQSEENLRNKFEDAEKNAPSIIFIDEVDAIASKREEVHGEVERRVVAQLLALMDGLKSRGRVVVIAASNIPNSLDPALRRGGRFDREIEIGVPSKEGRFKVLKIHTRNMPLRGPIYPKVMHKKILEKITGLSKAYEEKIQQIKKQTEDLKEKKRLSDPSFSQNITQKIGTIESSLVQAEQGYNLASTLAKEIEKNKKVLASIIEKIKKSEDSSPHFFNQQRQKILEIFSPEQKKLSEKLHDIGILSDDFIISVKNEGAVLDLKQIADITHGFVGADLASLAKESAMIVLRKIFPDLKLKENEVISKTLLEKLVITHDDFREALKVVRPSAMREVLIEVPNIKWDDIGGLNEVKQELVEAVEWPIKNPDAFKRMGVRPPRGILIYGAPGTGKTLLAKAVATESEANFILVKGPELISKWVGESEKGIRKIFDKARQTSPTIIFFDEIDSIAPRRGASSDNKVSERVVNQMLTEMDGLQDLHDVVVIAATNRPDIIDSALLRPGRFDRIILTKAPDLKAREEIFKIHAKGMPLEAVNIKSLAEKTEGYVGADVEAVCREAAMLSLRENIKADVVKMKHFEGALEKVRPSVTKEIEEAYGSIEQFFRSAKANEMKEEKPNYMG